MTKDAAELDVFDPRRWDLATEAVADLADGLRRLWSRFRHCFKTQTPDPSRLPRSKLRGIPNGMIVLGAAAPKPPLAIPPASKLGGILATLVKAQRHKRLRRGRTFRVYPKG